MVNFNLQLCAQSWKTLEKDIDRLGVQVYITMFEMDPAMLNLFSFKDDKLEESQGLKRHSGILMRTIETSLASAENMEKFVPYLTSLAQRHAQYGLRPGYFNVLGKSLVLTIERALGDKCSEDVKNAWGGFWSTMESILTPALLHAINKPETMKGMYAAPVRSSSKGNVLGKGQDAKREKTTVPNSNLVQETWNVIEQNPDHHGTRVFINFFKARPDMLQLFSFKDETPLEESAGLRRHAGIFIRTLGQAVAGLENLTSMLPYLRSLAARHVQYGVTSELIVAMGNAVFAAMEEGLGGQWTPEVQEAWAMAWAAVESAMTDAIDQVRRGKGELPQLPVYDAEEEEEREARGSPLPTLQHDFYRQIGLNKKKDLPPLAAPEPAEAAAATVSADADATPQPAAGAAAEASGEAGVKAAWGGDGPPNLEEDEEESDKLDLLQHEEEGFHRLRSAPSRKETMAMLPNNLLMVHQEINGLLATRADDERSETSSMAGSTDGEAKRRFPWQNSFKQSGEEESETEPLVGADIPSSGEGEDAPPPEAAEGGHPFHCKVAPEELAGSEAEAALRSRQRRCSTGGCAVQ